MVCARIVSLSAAVRRTTAKGRRSSTKPEPAASHGEEAAGDSEVADRDSGDDTEIGTGPLLSCAEHLPCPVAFPDCRASSNGSAVPPLAAVRLPDSLQCAVEEDPALGSPSGVVLPRCASVADAVSGPKQPVPRSLQNTSLDARRRWCRRRHRAGESWRRSRGGAGSRGSTPPWRLHARGAARHSGRDPLRDQVQWVPETGAERAAPSATEPAHTLSNPCAHTLAARRWYRAPDSGLQ